MFMIMFVSKTMDQATELLDIWVKAGVEGVTILESAGMQQLKDRGIREDVGIVFSLQSLTRAHEVHHRTLFSAVKDETILNRVVAATTQYVGDWTRADVGVLFVWPLIQAYGLDKTVR